MRQWIRRKAIWIAVSSLIVLLNLLVCSTARAEYQEFPDGFSLRLPQGWTRVPEDVFREKMQHLQKAYPKSGSLGYDYALQLESRDWFQYPYMLISVWEDYRVKLSKIPEMNEKFQRKFQGKQKGVTRNRLVTSSYDPKRRIFQAEYRFELSGNPIVLFKGLCYMNQGVLSFSYYLREGMYGKYAHTFEEMMDSLRLSAANLYQAESSREGRIRDAVLPYGKILIATGIIALLIGIYFWSKRYNSGN
ncbi:MAG: hypothetical protein K9K64_12435 [Desulfohalobiaceae bacterium]|nr:hypothetical protein [Desulfohalobiaceae bacterium]